MTVPGGSADPGSAAPGGGDRAGRRRRVLLLLLAWLGPAVVFVLLDLAVGEGFPWGGVYWGLVSPVVVAPCVLLVALMRESARIRRDHAGRYGRPPGLLARARAHPLGAVAEFSGGTVLAVGTGVSARSDVLAVVVFGFTAFWAGTTLTATALRHCRPGGGTAPWPSAVWFPGMQPRTGRGAGVAVGTALLGAAAVHVVGNAPTAADTVAGSALGGAAGLVLATRIGGATGRRGDVDVVPSRTACSPGEVLAVGCSTRSRRAADVRSATLTLRAVVRCRVLQGDAADFLVSEDGTTVQEVLSVPMRRSTASTGGTRFVAELVVPDVPPSVATGTLIGMAWELGVRVRVARGRDLHGSVSLEVRSAPPTPGREDVGGWVSQPGLRARLRTPRAVPVGTAVLGALEVESPVPTAVRDVHLVLAREERVVAGGLAHAQEFVVARRHVTDHADVPAEAVLRLPLDLTVPGDAPPGVVVRDVGEVAWTVRIGLLGPSGGMQVEQPLQVVRP
ncbi:hypothetical protein ACI78V_09545 [Geodermatophilus sp. SYSU D00742]